MCSVPTETLGIIPSGGDRIWVWKSDMGQEGMGEKASKRAAQARVSLHWIA